MGSSIERVLLVGDLEPAVVVALRALGVTVEAAPSTSWWGLARALRARPQLVLARAAFRKAALLGRVTSVPVVIAARPDDHATSVARGARFAARTVCGGAALRDLLLAEGAPAARTAVLRCLQPVSEPAGSGGASLRARWVVSAAPLDEPDRGVSDLLLAFLSVARTRPWARLLLAGPGAGARLLGQAEAGGLRGRVSWVPATPLQLPSLFAAASAAVGPSRSPAFADAIPEAMAAGAPLVATDVGAHPRWIREGRTGLLVPPRSPATLAARLAHLLDHPEEARTLGDEARRAAREQASPRARAAELLRCFESALRPEGPAGRALQARRSG
jgi:hypothetical protein